MAEQGKSTLGRVEEIRLDMLELGKSQARTDPSKGIQELAASIAKLGLMNPILVTPIGGGKHEIIAGQRRYLAHRLLNYDTIQAIVLDRPVDTGEAKARSLVENVRRRDLTTAEKIDACTELYKLYGSVNAVAERTGLRPDEVSTYVKYPQLVDELKEMVDQAQLDVKVALQAQRAATDSGGHVDAGAAVKFAQELRPMTNPQRKQFVKAAQEEPDASAEEKIEKGRAQPVLRQLIVTIEEGLHRRLQRFAKEEGMTQDEAAATLIEEALSLHEPEAEA